MAFVSIQLLACQPNDTWRPRERKVSSHCLMKVVPQFLVRALEQQHARGVQSAAQVSVSIGQCLSCSHKSFCGVRLDSRMRVRQRFVRTDCAFSLAIFVDDFSLKQFRAMRGAHESANQCAAHGPDLSAAALK
jgi:hypothetical protein